MNYMGQAIFSVRMDEDLKKEFEELCNDFGMNMTTAINIFAKAVVRERKIPFEIEESKKAKERVELMKTLNELKKQADKNESSNITFDEIIAEIEKYRESK